jgi:MFS family permease
MKGTGTDKVYAYRWIVLSAFVLVACMTQILWISFAPITSAAAEFYGTSVLNIGLLSMVFMVVYILFFLPAAWVIDTWGFKAAVGIGAVLSAVFALTRWIFASNFALVLASQTGIAIGQPFVIGAITKVAARWFPPRERATASGLGTLALYLGPLAAMLLGPYLFLHIGMRRMLLLYGLATAAAAVAFLVAARERPPTPAGPDERVLMFAGLKAILILLVMFFVGLGMFNGVATWIEDIVRPRGFTISQAGLLGGLMLVGGIVGAVVMPLFSDRSGRRKPFLLAALIGLIPGLVGMGFADSLGLLLFSGFIFGFFLLSAGPIGFQYAAEITHPAPEGTSNSLLLVMGQISGIIFIFAMNAGRSPSNGAMTASIVGLALMAAGAAALAVLLPESPLYQAGRRGAPGGGTE